MTIGPEPMSRMVFRSVRFGTSAFRSLDQVDEVRPNSALGEKPDRLPRVGAFLHTKDLNFHRRSRGIGEAGCRGRDCGQGRAGAGDDLALGRRGGRFLHFTHQLPKIDHADRDLGVGDRDLELNT